MKLYIGNKPLSSRFERKPPVNLIICESGWKIANNICCKNTLWSACKLMALWPYFVIVYAITNWSKEISCWQSQFLQRTLYIQYVSLHEFCQFSTQKEKIEGEIQHKTTRFKLWFGKEIFQTLYHTVVMWVLAWKDCQEMVLLWKTCQPQTDRWAGVIEWINWLESHTGYILIIILWQSQWWATLILCHK